MRDNIMMNGPLVSVIVTSYNRPRPLCRALRSVMRQRYSNIEIIVVDDDSKNQDEIENKATEEVGDEDILFIRHDSNKGLAAARNTGLENASGKMVSFLDDDDEWKPKKLTKQVYLAKQKDFSREVVYCGATKLSEGTGHEITTLKPKMKGKIRDNIRSGVFETISSSNLIKRKALREIGGFDESMKSHVDYDIWMKMAKARFSVDYIDESLVNIYEGGDQMTHRYRERVSATRKFIEKWRPFLQHVMGPKESKEFVQRLAVSVLSRQSAVAMARGDIRFSSKCFSYLISNLDLRSGNLKVGVRPFISAFLCTLSTKIN